MIRRALRLIRRQIYRPDVGAMKPRPTIRLGTDYGGWSFIDAPELHGSTIVSAGLGEDASFDVAFAKRYGATVLIVDPTPRAIAHFEAIAARIGRPAETAFAPGGKQPADAYDLTGLSADQLQLVPKALWTGPTTLRFYSPPDPSHVSHSIVNYQQSYRTDTPYIEVEAIGLADLGLPSIPLLKLDIEGAKVEVIADMLRRGIYPGQILVEFDEMNEPSRRAVDRYDETRQRLTDAGYELVAFNGYTDFLFVRRH